MTGKDPADLLRDLLQELGDIEEFTADGEAAFAKDVKTQKAVIRSYEVIGEVCKRLPAEVREAHTSIDWRRLITFRDFLAHNYDEVVVRYLWEAVRDLPNLKAAVEAVLDKMRADDGEDD